MKRFDFHRAASPADAIAAAAAEGAVLLGGGTNLLDLMKGNVVRPDRLVDVTHLPGLDRIERRPDGSTRIGALVRNGDLAHDPAFAKTYPAVAEALLSGASAQLRNAATTGGNLLQRTRCPYFTDGVSACNKREPGSGCDAIGGETRLHAVLGTSDDCIATYPGDWAQAMLALDATVEILGPSGQRRIPFAALHRPPGTTPNVETSLAAGDLITAFTVPAGPWTQRSLYLKLRDRQSYEFALASAAVALDMADGTVRDARIALGGVATTPWRAAEAEAILKGKPFDEAIATAAAKAAFAGARTREHNAYKVALGQETLVRALLQTASMEIRP